MSHTLSVSDGTTTVTFTTGDLYLAEYVPAVTSDLSQPIKEQAVVGFYRTIASIRASVNSLNRLFAQAVNYAQSGTGAKVYVQFDPDDTGDTYRSLCYGGTIKGGADFLGGEWGAANVEMTVEWTRQPYWEGPLTQVPLSNASDTDNTAGLAVVNHWDGSTDENYVDIAAGAILGDLPAAMKLQMTNGDTDVFDEFYVFHNVYSAPSSFVHIIEAESDTDLTATTDATCSGGAYAALTWDSTGETLIGAWTLASSDMSDAAGGHFAIVARWAGQFPYSDCWMRLKLSTSGTAYDLWSGSLSRVSASTDGRELSLLDTVDLPPYLKGQATISELLLRLYGKRDSTDSTVNLDYLMLAPISGGGGWLHVQSVAAGVPGGASLFVDEIEGITYRNDVNSNWRAEFQVTGGPILLVPNVAQRLYFLTSDNTGTASPSDASTVKLWYRPRRSSI